MSVSLVFPLVIPLVFPLVFFMFFAGSAPFVKDRPYRVPPYITPPIAIKTKTCGAMWMVNRMHTI